MAQDSWSAFDVILLILFGYGIIWLIDTVGLTWFLIIVVALIIACIWAWASIISGIIDLFR